VPAVWSRLWAIAVHRAQAQQRPEGRGRVDAVEQDRHRARAEQVQIVDAVRAGAPGVLHGHGRLVGHRGEEGDLVVVRVAAGLVVGVEGADGAVADDQGHRDEVLPGEAVELVVQR
jgi:hypothetical protein